LVPLFLSVIFSSLYQASGFPIVKRRRLAVSSGFPPLFFRRKRGQERMVGLN
jgi:hypothetical protein